MSDLFSFNTTASTTPLAARLRPQTLDQFVGLPVAVQSLLQRSHYFPNLILWGPPGSGKTTLAGLIVRTWGHHPVFVQAVDLGAKQIRELGEEAKHRRRQSGVLTSVFVDEIHRLNRGQQDVFLSFMEEGDFILIGATTENPGYELNAALLSRAQIIELKPLSAASLGELVKRGFQALGVDEANVLTEDGKTAVIESSDGDGRQVLNFVEALYWEHREKAPSQAWGREEVIRHLQKRLRYDKTGQQHYDCISAFIKSVRGSDPDAALYYLARMILGGEDPRFIARRLVILASEDVGNADPKALPLAVSAFQAVEYVGLPEAGINLAHVTCYLASAPKSDRSYQGYKRALMRVRETGSLPVPLALQSDVTLSGQTRGVGKGYHSAHEGARGWVPMEFLPEALRGEKFYEPSDRGFEKVILDYQNFLKGRGQQTTK